MTKNKVKEIHENGVVHPIYLAKQFLDTGIEELNLSMRSFNCLRRAGWDTIGDIIEAIDCKHDLMRVRNLGRTSAEEIFYLIIDYHFNMLTADEKPIYQKLYDELNGFGRGNTQLIDMGSFELCEKILLANV